MKIWGLRGTREELTPPSDKSNTGNNKISFISTVYIYSNNIDAQKETWESYIAFLNSNKYPNR